MQKTNVRFHCFEYTKSYVCHLSRSFLKSHRNFESHSKTSSRSLAKFWSRSSFVWSGQNISMSKRGRPLQSSNSLQKFFCLRTIWMYFGQNCKSIVFSEKNLYFLKKLQKCFLTPKSFHKMIWLCYLFEQIFPSEFINSTTNWSVRKNQEKLSSPDANKFLTGVHLWLTGWRTPWY